MPFYLCAPPNNNNNNNNINFVVVVVVVVFSVVVTIVKAELAHTHKHFDGVWLFFLVLQGYLVVNHLTREDLEDAVLYCKYHCLLAMSAEQRVGQLVIWREVGSVFICHILTCFKIGYFQVAFSLCFKARPRGYPFI